MTKSRQLTAVLAIAVAASAILTVAYVGHSNADAQPGCGRQRAQLDETLDQVRFGKSAEHSVWGAMDYSTETLAAYRRDVAAMTKQLAISKHSQTSVALELSRASEILNGQDLPLAHARAILTDTRRQLESGALLVNEASGDVQRRDCRTLAPTMAKSGWPKDHLVSRLAEAAHVNSSVSDNLETALTLITRAKRAARHYLVSEK